MRRRRAVILSSLAALLLLCGVGLYRHVRPYESNSLATVSWHTGGTAGTAQVTVVDATERPIVGANVAVDNDSGGNDATTDATGVAVVNLGEPEFKGLWVNKQKVVDRPLAAFIGTPTVSQGLVVSVKLKQPKTAG